MRAATLIGLALAHSGALWAQDDYPIHVYPSPMAEEAPEIDGVLNEAAWDDAPVVSGFTLYNAPEKAAVQTFVRATWDERALYFGVECDEPNMDKVAPKTMPRDSKPIFADEAIEIFVDPDHDHARYFQFGINAAGSLYDSRGTDPSWNSEAQVGARLGEDSWTVEVCIPWEDVTERTLGPGDALGFNVCRDRHVGQVREWTNWSQTKANFHDPHRFAHLVLSPTPEQLAKLSPEFRKGDRTGPITIFSSEGFAETTYAQLAEEAFGQLDAMLEELEKTRDQEQDRAAARLLGESIEARRVEIEGLRRQVDEAPRIDAALWTRTDTEVQRLLSELENSIWEARLHALLSQI